MVFCEIHSKDRLTKILLSAATYYSVTVSPLMIKELKRIIADSEVMKEDDHKWPKKNVVGKQELEIRFGNEHVSFEVKYLSCQDQLEATRICHPAIAGG